MTNAHFDANAFLRHWGAGSGCNSARQPGHRSCKLWSCKSCTCTHTCTCGIGGIRPSLPLLDHFDRVLDAATVIHTRRGGDSGTWRTRSRGRSRGIRANQNGCNRDHTHHYVSHLTLLLLKGKTVSNRETPNYDTNLLPSQGGLKGIKYIPQPTQFLLAMMEKLPPRQLARGKFLDSLKLLTPIWSPVRRNIASESNLGVAGIEDVRPMS